MSNWRLRPLMGLLLAGACGLAHASTATVYYYTPFKNWSTVYIHHNGSGSWTAVPGSLMASACSNWTSTTVDFGSASNFMAVFNNGANVWDNNSNANYTVPAGIHQVKNGALIANAGSPCSQGGVDTTPPSVPSNVVAGTKTATTIDLSWTASTDLVGVAGYEVYRNNSKVGTSTTTSFTDTGLTASTTYEYTFLAFDAAGNKSGLTPIFTTSTTAINTGNSVTVFYKPNSAWTTTNIHYSVSGTWTTPPGVAMEAACTGWVKKTIALNAATGIITTFNNGSGAWDSNGGSNYTLGSGNVTVNAGVIGAGDPCGPDKTPPTAPTNLIKSAGTSNSVSLSWTASTDIGGTGIRAYQVVRSGVAVGKTATNSFIDNTVQPGKSYTYAVRAIDLANNKSTPSNFLDVTVDPIDLIPPTSPTGLTKGTVTYNTVPLSWVAASDNIAVTGYDIYRNNALIGSSLGTSYSDGTATPLTTYSYTVKAKDAAKNISDSSAPLSVTTLEKPAVVLGEPLGTDMREDSIYFVMTARFFDGDSSNNRGGALHTVRKNDLNNDPMFRGDFKGLIQKLDYIKALGFSAIWITPVVLNRSDYDYHGYHGYDFYRVDPRLESPGASYQDLINAAHAKGIKIIQDIVYNHSSKFGAKGLSTPKFFGTRTDPKWVSFYDQYNPNFEYNGLDIEPLSGKSYYNGDTWSSTVPDGKSCNGWGTVQGGGYGCQWPSNDAFGLYESKHYHKCWVVWDGEKQMDCWIHPDLADFNTENKEVQDYLIGAYNKYIDMGVDGFRVDTVAHIQRVMFNRHFIPAAKQHAIDKFGAKGQNFYMAGEVGHFVNDKWNRGQVNLSQQFFTWKERKDYSTDDAVAVHEQFKYEQDLGPDGQPTSTNAFLNGNNYHAPDTSKCSGFDVIDMRMSMNFETAGNAFNNLKDYDSADCDATKNIVYVDSHDYSPPGKSSIAYNAGTSAWAENMSLMWTNRGIPTIFQGAEIEFKAGKAIDWCGEGCPLEETRRAYYGNNIEGTINAPDFGVSSGATGALATTMEKPLVKHLQRLNQIRRKIPALQKGQYSLDGITGGMAFKRRFTDSNVDSFALVALTNSATFTGIPNGTYKDAVTGDVKTVSNGTLTATVSGQGNARIYVLDTALTPAPGKIGSDGPFLKP